MGRKHKGFRSGKMREIAKRNYENFVQDFYKKKQLKELEESQKDKGFLESLEEIFSYSF